MNKLRLSISEVVVICCVFCVNSLSQSADPKGNVPKLATALSAWEQAQAFCGFKPEMYAKSFSLEKAVASIVANGDKTPFLSNQVDGKELWDIRFDSVRFFRDDNRHSVDVFLNKQTGELVKIVIGDTTPSTDILCEPSAEIATRELTNKREVYHSFLDSPPVISFYEALQNAPFVKVSEARSIIGTCVVQSRMGQAELPVWQILGRGVPTFSISHVDDNVPTRLKNRQRAVVNAVTGKLLFVTNSPRGVPCDKLAEQPVSDSGKSTKEK